MTGASWASKAVTVVALTGLAFGAGEIRRDLHFKVGKRPTVSINNPYGPIVVKAGVPHHVVVSAILHSDKVELDQSSSRNRVDVISHLLPGADQNTGLVEYEVQVPPQADLIVHSENGRIHIEKLQGDIATEGSDSSIEVLDCSNGHVHVRTLNGPVNLSNVRNVHVEIVSMGGDVQLSGVDGPLVSVNSNSGKIQYAGDFGDEGEYDFTSHTGDIEAVAPAYASIDVLARSNGRIENDFALEPKHTPFYVKGGNAFAGTLNKAASSVKLFSFSGKIHLKKRQN
jgi:hypothetical protein